MYDISPDRKHFLLVQAGEPLPSISEYRVVLNWFEELKRLVPTEWTSPTVAFTGRD